MLAYENRPICSISADAGDPAGPMIRKSISWRWLKPDRRVCIISDGIPKGNELVFRF